MPLERNRCFTGRETALRHIRQALTSRGVAGLSQVQAIAGLGGVGKTQTALEYACRYYWDADPTEAYQAVFWLRVDTPQAMQSGFQAIAEILALPQAEAKEPEVITQAVKTWLAEHGGWLLVLDNADDPSFVGPCLPKQGQGHVLITSRVSNLQSLGIVKPLPLDALDPDEALAFLLKRTERHNNTPDENTAATDLCAELGHLPLALEQAAAYIVATHARFQDYLASYRRRRLELLNQSAPMLGEYRDPIATTWNINFEAVETESPVAADLLRVSAFLHPDSIPYDLIVLGAALLGEPIQQALAEVEADPLAFVALLEPLRRYSLVRSEVEQTYSIHRLVQAVVRDNLDEDKAKLWAERVVRLVTQAYPNADDFSNWPECERLLLHAQAAAATIWQYRFDFEEAGLLLICLGFYFRQRGQYAETEPCYERSLGIYKKALGDDHPNVATSMNNLAELYRVQGRYSEAEPLHQEALALRKQLLGEAHPDVATSLNNLASLYYSQGRYSEAEPLYQEALALRKQLLGEAHPAVAASLNNLAALYKSQGCYSEAEPLYQEALALMKQLLGEAHPDVATSLNNLAGLYFSQGRYSEAEPLYQDALRKQLLGDDHPDVATSLNNLALLYKSQGRYSEAEPLYQDALALRKQLLGDDHPDTAGSLFNLGALRYQQGQVAEAQALLLRALPIYQSALGLDHPRTKALQSWVDAVQQALDNAP